MRNGFVFLQSYYDSLKGLTNTKRLRLYDAIMQYVFDGLEPDLPQTELKALFTAMRPNIDSACRRYDANVQNGIKSVEARRKRREELAGSEPNANEENVWFELDKEKDKEKENEKEKDSAKEAAREREVWREAGLNTEPPTLITSNFESWREKRMRELSGRI